MNVSNMIKGTKCFIYGPKYMGGKYSKSIASYGVIEENVAEGAVRVLVHLEKDETGRSSFAFIPVCCIYETEQAREIQFDDIF